MLRGGFSRVEEQINGDLRVGVRQAGPATELRASAHAPPRGRPALAIPYSVLITLASAKSSCVRPPAACVESVIRSRL